MLIDTILDLAGVDYDAVDHRLLLRPVLPGPWPQTGIKQSFPCGDVSYRLERPIGGKVHHLNLKAQLKHPVTLAGRAHLSRPDRAGPVASVAPDARADARPAHRPAALERHAAVEHQRVELDVGLSRPHADAVTAPAAAARPGIPGTSAAASGRRTRSPNPAGTQPGTKDDPLLEVVPE